MTVPLFDAARLEPELTEHINAAALRVLASGDYILGGEVRAFEEEVAARIGAGHALGVGNGTDALWVALRAVGVGPGDVVLTSPFTFFATVSAILSVGATPVFADIDPETFNLDPDRAAEVLDGSCEVLQRHGVAPERIKAMIPVHLYGQAADMTALSAVARRFGVALIEDAAQAFGADWDGRQVGSLADLGCFSFFPTKNLGTAGDGGLVTTDNSSLADRVRAIRAHGSTVRYRHDLVGSNTRLDSIHAAILRCKLPYVERWIATRRDNARKYDEVLSDVEGVAAPTEAKQATHTYNQYTMRVQGGRRDKVREDLAKAGVGTAVYYPLPVHLQPALADCGHRTGDFPVAEAACSEVLSIPVHPHLRDDERMLVADALTGLG